MKATYVTHMGGDEMVVNAARVSFNKLAENYSEEQNNKLITYLATHGHWTPFAHPQVQFHFKAPIFVARQLAKHQVGMVWNEVSRRYVDDSPEFYWPDKWKGRPTNKKQGSSDESIETMTYQYINGEQAIKPVDEMYASHVWVANHLYNEMLEAGICPEQARMVLPQSMITEWYWTGSLAAWARVYGLRTKEDTQEETRYIVNQIGEDMERLFPVSWKALTG